MNNAYTGGAVPSGKHNLLEQIMSAQRFAIVLKARELFKSLGGKTAGGYLRNRHFTLNEALQCLGMRVRYLGESA